MQKRLGATPCSFLSAFSSRSASERRIPLVVTLHSVYLWAPFYWSVLAGANRIIAVGPAQARFVGPWKDKTVIIPNGIDTTVFTPGDELADNPITVLWYGRVDGRLNRGLVASILGLPPFASQAWARQMCLCKTCLSQDGPMTPSSSCR